MDVVSPALTRAQNPGEKKISNSGRVGIEQWYPHSPTLSLAGHPVRAAVGGFEGGVKATPTSHGLYLLFSHLGSLVPASMSVPTAYSGVSSIVTSFCYSGVEFLSPTPFLPEGRKCNLTQFQQSSVMSA